MVTGMMTVYAMTIADSKKPIVLDLTEVLYHKVRVLVGFGRFRGDVTSTCLVSYLKYGVLHTDINDILLHLTILGWGLSRSSSG